MSSYEGRPIFIFGNQRSGTRMVASILNQHKNIVITDEAHSFSNLHALIRQADRMPRNDGWKYSRVEIAQNFMIETSAQYIRDSSTTARRFGNKTPGLEFMLDQVKSIFPDAIFIYCLRHPVKVVRSLKNMPWNKRTTQENWDRFKASVEIFEKMKPRAMLVQVDQVSNVDEQRKLVRDLLDFVGEDLDENMPYYSGDEWTPANTIKKPLDSLSDTEMSSITNDRYYKKFCKKYGYDQ
ncbi:sulfotransferase [Halomonas cupida]|uniref:sulfotransferase family protein n=1 Tax=Halomonas cupida TaxID=44933 RepID=UPI0039B6560E